MYKYSNYKTGSGAAGVPKRAHNHALSSAISHMQLGILLGDDKLFRTAFKNFKAAIKYQRKDGSMPIETRRGGRAMFYQARAMNSLAVIAILAEKYSVIKKPLKLIKPIDVRIIRITILKIIKGDLFLTISNFIFLVVFCLSLTSFSQAIEPDIFVQSTVNRASQTLSKDISKKENITLVHPFDEE